MTCQVGWFRRGNYNLFLTFLWSFLHLGVKVVGPVGSYNHWLYASLGFDYSMVAATSGSTRALYSYCLEFRVILARLCQCQVGWFRAGNYNLFIDLSIRLVPRR